MQLRIQTCKGLVMMRQKLDVDRRELAQNYSCVGHYGVGDENLLLLLVSSKDLQAITIRSVCGEEIEFHIEMSRNVEHVNRRSSKEKASVNLKDQEPNYMRKEIEDQQRFLTDIYDHEHNDIRIHLLVRKPINLGGNVNYVPDKRCKWKKESEDLPVVPRLSLERKFLLEPLGANPNIELPVTTREMINCAIDGLERGYWPVRSTEGSGGTYFMYNPSGRNYVAVFKPIDEEPLAVNNPQGLPLSVDGVGLKKGTRVGEGALREAAAYLLDHPRHGPRLLHHEEAGFAGVPPTVLVKCLHPGLNHPKGYKYSLENIKIGSLQLYVQNAGSAEDMGPRSFSVDDVHKISVLDIRLANADRHAGNILVGKHNEDGRNVLIPIDHGYCLPENFQDCTFDWLYWPQARQCYSPDVVEYIKSLDAEQDIELLKLYGWDVSTECARILRISTMLLKKGADRGLAPFAIGSIMCREALKEESKIEQIVEEALEAMLIGTSEAAFLDLVSSIMDCHLDHISTQ